MAEEKTETTETAETAETQETTLVTEDKGSEETTETEGKEAVEKDGAEEKAEGVKDDKVVDEGAPEQYEAYQLPEGVVINEELTTSFNTLAKELDLTQAEAQKLVTMQTEAMTAAAKAEAEAWVSLQTDWQKQSKEDSEIGGTEFDANLGIAKLTLDKFGTPALNKMAEETGAGNHVEFLRLLYRVGKEIGEDVLRSGTKAPAQVKTQANVLFPDMN